jgi:hypothetical protein
VLKEAILSAWSQAVSFLAMVREKFLQVWGKFLDWLLNGRANSTAAGRPTIDVPSLTAQRTIINDMLSCWWGEVGWQLPRATTREELRAALEPLKDHADRNRINRLLIPTAVSAKAEQIREAREANGLLIANICDAQNRQRLSMDSVTQAQIALGQASPNQLKAVKAKLSQLQAESEEANRKHRTACNEQDQFQSRIDLMEAGFAQDELLRFIDKRFINGKYARNPRNLADAMAGLPWAYGIRFLGVWQSYARCTKIDCPPHPRFQLFETIQSIWKISRKSKLPVLEFFFQQITALPKTKTVKKIDPMTEEEFEDQAENWIRSHLLDLWPIWSLAIERSLEPPVEQDRLPFLICANFTKVQSDPKTSVLLVLGATEKAETKNPNGSVSH